MAPASVVPAGTTTFSAHCGQFWVTKVQPFYRVQCNEKCVMFAKTCQKAVKLIHYSGYINRSKANCNWHKSQSGCKNNTKIDWCKKCVTYLNDIFQNSVHKIFVNVLKHCNLYSERNEEKHSNTITSKKSFVSWHIWSHILLDYITNIFFIQNSAIYSIMYFGSV